MTDLILIDFRCFKFGDSIKLGVGLIFDLFLHFPARGNILEGMRLRGMQTAIMLCEMNTIR